ncbi:MAG TPA: DUF3592 domain-containing protein [Gemmata sp.]|nr:DUF3592 domain-containing protein [Gemmata sp.]
MNFACQNCHNLIIIPPGERPPPWCSKCGADFKSDDPRLAQMFATPREELATPWDRGRMRTPPVPQPPVPRPVEHAIPEETAASNSQAAELEAPPQPRESNLGVKVLVAAGTLFLLAGLGLGTQKYMWVRDCATTDGVVVAPPADQGGGSSRVKYTVDEKVHVLHQPGAAIGDTVTVHYRPDNPDDAIVWDPISIYRWPGVFALVGFGTLVIGFSALALRPTPEKKQAEEKQSDS